jgi:2-hydroxychromene-2-carboxylate isomerase
MSTIEFWFEFASTYSYPAAHAVEAAARSRRVQVKWRSFLLAPIFNAQGWHDSPFNIYPVKGAYMWRDLARICVAQELPLRRPSQFPRNGLLAARVACRFAEEKWVPAFVRSVYSANFAEDREITSRDVVADILGKLGQSPVEILAAAETEESKQLLRAQTDRAIAIGIFGAPTFVAEGELFWGGDRLTAALDWAQGKRKVIAL